jgi:hypothetical protein
MSWYPEICYEESDEGVTSRIPFIPVPAGEVMPPMLFVFESRETGELEPGPQGEDLPVIELDLHQYADMAILKGNLSAEHYDIVRGALGLESLNQASEKGARITQTIKDNVTKPQLEYGSD